MALRQSETRCRTLVENAADSFLVLDAAEQIVDCNQSACEALGYAREELLGLAIAALQTELTPEDLAALQQKLSTERTVTLESDYRRKDGSTFPSEARIRLSIAAAGETRQLLLVRDMTERKQGELAATTVREVRNLLTTVWMGLQSFQALELSSATSGA